MTTTESAAIPTPASADVFETAMRKALPSFPLNRQSVKDGDCSITYVSAGTQHAWRGYQLAATPALPAPGRTILTDERIEELWNVAEKNWLKACRADPKTAGNLQFHFARAIEADLRATLASTQGKGEKKVRTSLALPIRVTNWDGGDCLFDANDRPMYIDVPSNQPYRKQLLEMVKIVNATQVCTCPSGDGSLRWPCPIHPSHQSTDKPAEGV
jgi:hypothetical protein